MGLTAIKPLSITLKGDENWHDCIELIQTTANTAKIWNYIDPANENAPVLLEALKEPTYATVHPATEAKPVVAFSDLTANEAQEFNLIRKDFREKEQALLDMRALIQASVEPALFTHTRNCPTARDMLLKLKAEYCANPIVRERQLLAQYTKLPDVEGDRPLFDVIQALKPRMPGFYNVWYFNILDNSHNTSTLTVRDLISKLKDYLRDNEGNIPARGRNAAFASFQDQEDPDQSNQSNQS